MDLTDIAHLASSRPIPVYHHPFFDGFRTSHEIQKVEVMEYDELEPLIDKGSSHAFRLRHWIRTGRHPRRGVRYLLPSTAATSPVL